MEAGGQNHARLLRDAVIDCRWTGRSDARSIRPHHDRVPARAAAAQQQQQQWERPPGTRPTSVEARLDALERLAAAEGKSIERSLSVRVTRLEHRILGQESTEIETERLGTTIGALETTTRLLEGRIASLERARSTPGTGTGSEDLAALRRSVDRLSSAVDDLEDRVRRLELRRP